MCWIALRESRRSSPWWGCTVACHQRTPPAVAVHLICAGTPAAGYPGQVGGGVAHPGRVWPIVPEGYDSSERDVLGDVLIPGAGTEAGMGTSGASLN